MRARRLIRGAGWGLAALAGVALLLVLAGQVVTGRAMRRPRVLPPAPPAVSPAAGRTAADSAALVARGRRLVEVVARCGECHGDDLGGKVLADDALLGRLAAANLTGGRGGVARRTDADLARAIRHGVGPGGRALVVMPSDVYQAFDDADLGAIVAWLRAAPPVDREVPPVRVGPMTGVLYMAGLFPLFAADEMTKAGAAGGADTMRRVTPPPAPTAEYGAHLATVAGCRGCHGAELGGDGVHGAPGAPKAPNLTRGGALAAWREADFVRAIRTGRRPDGSAISEAMPWKYMDGLTDEELRALWLYSRSVPPRQVAVK